MLALRRSFLVAVHGRHDRPPIATFPPDGTPAAMAMGDLLASGPDTVLAIYVLAGVAAITAFVRRF